VLVREIHLAKILEKTFTTKGGNMRYKKLAAILMLVIFFTGCAALMPQLPQTPEDKSTFFMSYYMAQLQDFNARYDAAMNVGASDFDKQVLSAKHAFLMNAWSPIAMYDSYAQAGEIPPAELEAQINGLIDRLENMLKEGQNE
jgi:hypothetical protein